MDAFSVRKEAKGHGTGRVIEGCFSPGDEVVVVEDVITTGGSAQRAIAAVADAGGRVLGVLAVVDRGEGGRGVLEGEGRGVVVLVGVRELGVG
jgi:orotate phosphoribosyltransferase